MAEEQTETDEEFKKNYQRLEEFQEKQKIYGNNWPNCLIDYDIKCEMHYFNGKETKKNHEEYKLTNFFKDTAKLNKKGLNSIFDEKEINEDIFIKRYILFKWQKKKGCQFDCDHLRDPYSKEHRLVDQFWEYYFAYDIDEPKDTIFSMELLWRKVFKLVNITTKNGNSDQNTSKFKNEFEGTNQISNQMGEDLYRAFARFAHYCHTIGNITPCPKGFNTAKATAPYDRFDLYINYLQKNWGVKIDDEIIKKYYLEEVLNPELIDEEKLNIILADPLDQNNKKMLIEYIDNIINIIKARSNRIQRKVKEVDEQRKILEQQENGRKVSEKSQKPKKNHLREP